MSISMAQLLAATGLTKQGRLVEATRAIQAALRGRTAEPVDPAPDVEVLDRIEPSEPMDRGDVVDVAFRELRGFDVPPSEAVPPEVAQPEIAPPSSPPPRTRASFTLKHFQFGEDRYRYRLYVPGTAEQGPRPLLVLLHGCKQDSDDFARGTAMNALAQRENFVVLYPEQLRKSNSMHCWNWFDPRHQQADAGEPAMIAALVRQVVASAGCDPTRVYVAGLSAGGAMATLLGQLHPDLFAAVGVHSGLPAGSANDVTSAFGAMRRGVSKGTRAVETTVPTIVFHGLADKTVSPANGEAVVQAQLAAWRAQGTPLRFDEAASGPARWSDASGRTMLEHWTMPGAGHAWSGGNASGSFTDPAGPSASEAMVRFFLQHRSPTPS